MRLPQVLGFASALALGGSVAVAQEGGIEIFAGETLFESGLRANITQLIKPRGDLFRGSNEVPDPLGRSVDEYRTVVGLDFGYGRDATYSVLLPFVRREFEIGPIEGDASGFGDVVALGKYRFFREEGRARSINASVIAGIEMPTGETDETFQGVRLGPTVQPGRGAWNPFVAVSGTRGIDRFRFDATAFYKLNTEGSQRYEAGDFWSLTGSVGYRFLHYKYPGPTFGAKLGLQWRHQERASQNGGLVVNSGADELLLLPGLVIHPIPRLDVSIGVRIPIYQHYEGEQLGRDVEFVLTFGSRF